MAREKKTKASEQQEDTVSVDMAKLTEGISLVFSGAVKMLEAVRRVDVGLVLNTVNVPVVVDTGEELTIEEAVPVPPYPFGGIVLRDGQIEDGVIRPLLVFVGVTVENRLIKAHVLPLCDVEGNADDLVTARPCVLFGSHDLDDVCAFRKLLEVGAFALGFVVSG